MSNLINCDGPDCHETKPIDGSRRLCDGDWLMLEQGDRLPNLDFHSRACMAAWATRQAGDDGTPCLCRGPMTDHTVAQHGADEPCTCHRAQGDPHTKAEHFAGRYRTTTVDGR